MDSMITVCDIKKVNKRDANCHTELPDNIKYATVFDLDRDAIMQLCLKNSVSNGLYNRTVRLHDSILILSDQVTL
jgi:hypothetical protein